MRLKDHSGPAEKEELVELDRLVEESEDAFIKSGLQNLMLMIWPTREETFDMVRNLTADNTLAANALLGWESRTECGLILTNDLRGTIPAQTRSMQPSPRGAMTPHILALDPSSMQETRLLRSIQHMGLCITSRYIRKSTPKATKPGKLTPNDRLSVLLCSSSIPGR